MLIEQRWSIFLIDRYLPDCVAPGNRNIRPQNFPYRPDVFSALRLEEHLPRNVCNHNGQHRPSFSHGS